MRKRIGNFFASLLSVDMGKQARQVEIATLVVFFLLLVTVGWFWQYKIELSELRDGKRVVIGKLNVFEILLSKRGD